MSEAAGRELRSLLLGYRESGRLVFAGKVGTGFNLTLGRDLLARMEKLARPDPPFAMVPAAYRHGARWTAPQLVVEVAFTSWTTDGVLRHPSFEGIREDKAAEDVTLERPLPSARMARTTYAWPGRLRSSLS